MRPNSTSAAWLSSPCRATKTWKALFVAFVAVLGAAHIEGVAIESGWIRVGLDEYELRLRIDEAADQPRA